MQSSSNSSSNSSSSCEKFKALENEIDAVKYCLKGGNSTDAPENICESTKIYEGGDKAVLLGILKALQEEKTSLIISKASVENKGALTSIGLSKYVNFIANDNKSFCFERRKMKN